MARTPKITYVFEIAKNAQKQGAWLLLWTHSIPEIRDADGMRSIAIEDIESSQGASAWTTATAAKRAAAAMVDRSRLPWNDINGDGTVLTAEVEVKAEQ